MLDYAKVGGDANPIHVDPVAAAKSRFGQQVVHGMLSAGLFGTAMAACIPGAIYMNQKLAFTAPVFIDETVVARIEVQEIDRQKVTCSTVAYKVNKDDSRTPVVEGAASVLVPQEYLEDA